MTKPETRGARFRREALDAYSFTLAEALLLDELADALDQRDSATSDASRRGWAIIVSRLISQLGLDAAGAERVYVDGKSRRAQAAARSRWHRGEGGE